MHYCRLGNILTLKIKLGLHLSVSIFTVFGGKCDEGCQRSRRYIVWRGYTVLTPNSVPLIFGINRFLIVSTVHSLISVKLHKMIQSMRPGNTHYKECGQNKFTVPPRRFRWSSPCSLSSWKSVDVCNKVLQHWQCEVPLKAPLTIFMFKNIGKFFTFGTSKLPYNQFLSVWLISVLYQGGRVLKGETSDLYCGDSEVTPDL